MVRGFFGKWISEGAILWASYLRKSFWTSINFSSFWKPKAARTVLRRVADTKLFQNPPDEVGPRHGKRAFSWSNEKDGSPFCGDLTK